MYNYTTFTPPLTPPRLQTMTQPQSVDVRHEVIKLLYPIGATIDPVTNTRLQRG